MEMPFVFVHVHMNHRECLMKLHAYIKIHAYLYYMQLTKLRIYSIKPKRGPPKTVVFDR